MSANGDAKAACQALRGAAELNRDDPNRSGSLLEFGGAGQLVLTGDMHGNLKNFEKLQRYCALDRSPARYVILHELIHEELIGAGEQDMSIDLLVRAAQWKCDFPDNVFFLQSNHELAQLRGQEITKGGRSVLYDFERGVGERYGEQAAEVMEAVHDYLDSLPLAAKTRNGVFVAHSLPERDDFDNFDYSLFEREPTEEDLSPHGWAYSLVWGRFHTEEQIEHFAQQVGAEVLVVGHTPQEEGYRRVGRMLIIASDHNHGVFLPVDLAKQYTAETLEKQIRKFVSVE